MKTLMYEIVPGRLWMGPQLLDVPRLTKQAAMDAKGITTVINLWHQRDTDLACGVEQYWHVPLPDGLLNDERLAQWDAVGRRGALLLESGGVLTQCYGGRNRSALLAGLIAWHALRITGAEAVEMVRAGRGKAAFENRQYAAWLASLPSSSMANKS